jgi:UTP--glucose-1-phosphate uridylyltransferase
MIRKAILPAAGLGTRFLPATKASPKEMLPIVDKPMIQYSVEEAESCGIREFIIITGKNKRAIEDHFDSAFELEENLRLKGDNRLINEITKHGDLRFAYIRQGRPLGLGHAIQCAKPFAKKESFAVLLGDDIIDPDDTLLSDMIKIYNKYNAPVIALQEIPEEEVSRYGVIDGVKVENQLYRVKSLVEKPAIGDSPSNLAIIGRYILTPDIFEILEQMPPGRNGEYQLTDALNELAKQRDVYGYLFKGRRYDAGDKFGFLQATINLALKRPEFSDQLKEYITNLATTFGTKKSD